MHGPIGYGHGMVGVFGAIVGFLGTLILIAIVVAVLFFLIRFLIIGTKAAQLYLDTHRVAASAAPVVEPVETAAPVVEPVETAAPETPAAAPTSTSTRKPRTPKAPLS